MSVQGPCELLHVERGRQEFPDAAWSYEDPYDEHRDPKDRVAFYTEKFPDIQVETVA